MAEKAKKTEEAKVDIAPDKEQSKAEVPGNKKEKTTSKGEYFDGSKAIVEKFAGKDYSDDNHSEFADKLIAT